MKSIVFLIFLIYSSNSIAQNFEDGFDDGDFTTNPTWIGADSNFVVFDLNGNQVLRLNDNEAGASYLSTPSTNTIGEWDFFIQIDGSAPSNSNKAEIFLMSNISDLAGPVNGYGIRIGETGDDTFHLVRFDEGVQTIILSDTTVFKSGGSNRVKVTRDENGTWNLEVGEGYYGELKNSSSSIVDNTYSASNYFGVLVTYTSTRADDYYFDFKIEEPVKITKPLYINSFAKVSSTILDLTFSRDIDFASVETTYFTLNGNINPESFSEEESNKIRLAFQNSFSAGENQLAVSNIESATKDTILTDTTLTFFVFDEFEEEDVIINEFLKDPPPGSGLSEYVELKNLSSKYLNLKNWRIGDNNSLATISDEDLVILPDSFLVVTSDPEALFSMFGDGVYVDVSLPALNNTTDQIRLFNDLDVIVDSLEYTPEWGGVDIALERKSEVLSGAIQANWGDSPVEIGTPGRENDVEVDTTPPELIELSIVNDSTLQLVFSETLNPEIAQNTDNYLLWSFFDMPVGFGFKSAELDPNNTVTIVLAQSINTDTYTLRINNLEDFFGNIAEEIEYEFEYLLAESSDSGDVIINEFMYDPADEYSEFVEIYNRSNKILDLKSWTFNDNSGNRREIIKETYFLKPDDFVVLAVDSTIAVNFFGTPLIVVPSFPALNNGSDNIVLRNAEGLLMDSLTYSSDWGGIDVSLERKSPTVSGIYKANWGDSPAINFGTPGALNEIEQDVTSPIVQSIQIPNSETILLKFNEGLDIASATEIANFSISPTQTISNISSNLDSVKISLSQSLQNGTELTIIIRNQSDIFGNITVTQTVEATYFEINPSFKNEVVINEFLYRRKDELSPEFVELYNTSGKNFDLSGWVFKDASSSRVILPEGTILPEGDFLVLTDREDFANSLENGIYLSNFPSLNDSGDEIIIMNENGITIDSLYYQSSWGGNTPGISVERKDPERASNDASNWASSIAEIGFSAGTQSSVYEEDNFPPEIIFASNKDSTIKVVFSEFVKITDETTLWVFENPAKVIEGDSSGTNSIQLEVLSAKTENQKITKNKSEFTLRIENLRDLKGNINNAQTVDIAFPIIQNKIIINEIMYDPLADNEDNLPDQMEYIELYNPSDVAVSLEGIFLHDAPDEYDEIRSLEPVTSQFKWIEPEGYFLIYSEDEATTFSESKTARYFGLEDDSGKFTMQIERSSLSLAASGDAIYLADSSGVVIDSVFYDESWQNPNIYDTDGIALERINPQGESNLETNWSSSTHVSGGTPNMQNSIFQKPGVSPETSGISFTPNPFSPDDDGFEDNLYINYKLDNPDYLLRVRIFDRYGRLVRELVDGVEAGFEGSLLWDGLTDDRKKNRVGIYIVLFEAYNSANGSDRTFKETVVLARMF